jgi:membrane-bound metal-dependent hydrolase YbcI (DUF457 family)
MLHLLVRLSRAASPPTGLVIRVNCLAWNMSPSIAYVCSIQNICEDLVVIIINCRDITHSLFCSALLCAELCKEVNVAMS